MAAANYEELQAEIGRAFPALSRQLQRIARFALERPQDVALDTVAVAAGKVEVQPSAMVRFAQALGYDGYTDMQRIFRDRLVERSSSYRERPDGPRGSGRRDTRRRGARAVGGRRERGLPGAGRGRRRDAAARGGDLAVRRRSAAAFLVVGIATCSPKLEVPTPPEGAVADSDLAALVDKSVADVRKALLDKRAAAQENNAIESRPLGTTSGEVGLTAANNPLIAACERVAVQMKGGA